MTELDQESMGEGSRASSDSLDFAVEAARLLEDRHCTEVQLLDLRGISQVCDFILIGSGTSDRQMRSVADEIGTLGKERGATRFRTNNDPASTWIIVDFIDLVVHLFEPSRRAYYDLEDLWSDSSVVEFAR
ncbi:MAG: ribosome silencing factor [Phycisphaerales bacterium]|nr:ribosome silencing factor [Phycisphaerales bacterium]